MSHTELDQRVTAVEERTREVEHGHDEAIYGLTRDTCGLTLWAHRLTEGVNGLLHGQALIMRHLGIPPVETPAVTVPTDEEIDAALETRG